MDLATQQFIGHSAMPVGYAFEPPKTHQIFARPGCEVHGTSASLGWRNLFISLQREPVSGTAYGAAPHHLMVVQVTGPGKLTWGMSGRPTTKAVVSGSCTLMPGGEGFSIRIADFVESVHVYLRKELVDRVMSALAC